MRLRYLHIRNAPNFFIKMCRDQINLDFPMENNIKKHMKLKNCVVLKQTKYQKKSQILLKAILIGFVPCPITENFNLRTKYIENFRRTISNPLGFQVNLKFLFWNHFSLTTKQIFTYFYQILRGVCG